MDRVPEPEVWAARMRDLMHDCVASAPHEECDRVREAACLLKGGALAGPGNRAMDSRAIEQMLACGAAESAVLALLRPGTAFMLSRGQGNCCLASVLVEDGASEVMAEGSTLALALLSAYVAGLVARIEDERGGDERAGDETAARGLPGASPIAWLH